MPRINSLATGTVKQQSKSLDKNPFTRVVGYQRTTGNRLSPFKSFYPLVSLLTRSSPPVMIIPIAVTTKEAELMRMDVIKEERVDKELIKHERHPRLINRITRRITGARGYYFQTTVYKI